MDTYEGLVKVCSICGEEKIIGEFYKQAGGKYGVTSRCKDCLKKIDKINRERFRARRLARKKAYNREHKQERKAYKQAHPEQQSKSLRRWKIKNSEKASAHKKVARAISSGKIKRCPCEICGTTINIHAHHDNYKKPLDVIWLCAEHHRWIHS